MIGTKPKLTPWFVKGEKPARPGVYNVSCQKENQSGLWYALWDGEKWFRGNLDATAAAKMTFSTISRNYWHRYGSWRGLAENPE